MKKKKIPLSVLEHWQEESQNTFGAIVFSYAYFNISRRLRQHPGVNI